MGIIYKIRSTNGKCKEYIGQTRDTFNKRMSAHKSASGNLEKKDGCRALNAAIRKYGWETFEKITIFECSDEELNDFETLFITAFNTIAPFGYNLTYGGDSNLKSDDTKKKMRESALARDSVVYRKRESTKGLLKYVGEWNNGYKISKHPRCNIKYFCDKPTKEENLADTNEFLMQLNADENLIVIPKKHDLGDGIQRCGNGYRARYNNKRGIEQTARFTSKKFSKEENLKFARDKLKEFIDNDN